MQPLSRRFLISGICALLHFHMLLLSVCEFL